MCLTDPRPDAEVLSTWELSPLRRLAGGDRNHHWLVETRGGRELVLRRYREDCFADLDYEFEVMRLLGAPTPELVEQPIDHAGTTWCLLTKLPGNALTATDKEEQRHPGRLLAEFHQAAKELTHLGQRQLRADG